MAALSQEREMLTYCRYKGIGIIPYSPLASGDLARSAGASTARLDMMKGTPFERVLSSADKTIISRVEELAKNYGCSMSQVALAWIQTKADSPIVGISSVRLSFWLANHCS